MQNFVCIFNLLKPFKKNTKIITKYQILGKYSNVNYFYKIYIFHSIILYVLRIINIFTNYRTSYKHLFNIQSDILFTVTSLEFLYNNTNFFSKYKIS